MKLSKDIFERGPVVGSALVAGLLLVASSIMAGDQAGNLDHFWAYGHFVSIIPLILTPIEFALVLSLINNRSANNQAPHYTFARYTSYVLLFFVLVIPCVPLGMVAICNRVLLDSVGIS